MLKTEISRSNMHIIERKEARKKKEFTQSVVKGCLCGEEIRSFGGRTEAFITNLVKQPLD